VLHQAKRSGSGNHPFVPGDMIRMRVADERERGFARGIQCQHCSAHVERAPPQLDRAHVRGTLIPTYGQCSKMEFVEFAHRDGVHPSSAHRRPQNYLSKMTGVACVPRNRA
jgi:hypothetical protein